VKLSDKPGHPIADAHPGNSDAIIFPGQDYNNARIYDFEDVDKWRSNKRGYAPQRILSCELTNGSGPHEEL
jgi:hypothetical protein